jgi:hypothetical protein
MKLALTLMMETRVVESPRVRAAVKSAHMRALKRRLRPKKVARRRRLMVGESGARERKVAMEEARVEVRAVVVLLVRRGGGVSWEWSQGGRLGNEEERRWEGKMA